MRGSVLELLRTDAEYDRTDGCLIFKAIIAWAARNQHHSENVRLGQARKRAQVEAVGEQYQHGRRPTDTDVVTKVRELASQGLSRRKIAEAAGVSVGTVQNLLANK